MPDFDERLTPGPGGWIAAMAVGASFGFVVLPFAGTTGFVVGALIGATAGYAVMRLTSARVTVTGTRFVAGRASIDRRDLGPVEILAPERLALLRGREIDPRAYHCQRGWIRGGVKVAIDDPADPTPYWLVSSRRPEALAEALRGPAG